MTARGLDVQQVKVVVNFDMPRDCHAYLHRIGRSGRWGRKGLGISLVTSRDKSALMEVERYFKCTIGSLDVQHLNSI